MWRAPAKRLTHICRHGLLTAEITKNSYLFIKEMGNLLFKLLIRDCILIFNMVIRGMKVMSFSSPPLAEATNYGIFNIIQEAIQYAVY